MWAFILIGTCMVELMICAFGLYRNTWVCRERIKLIDKDYAKYKKLPSYETMLWGDKFWRFDINIYT